LNELQNYTVYLDYNQFFLYNILVEQLKNQKFNQSIDLLDQIIGKKQIDDTRENDLSGGESWDLHHLKSLRTILIKTINASS
jgi:hypothetical protein